MLNSIFWKKVQGQKHPGRWGIVEHQIPSIKVVFKIKVGKHILGHQYADEELSSEIRWGVIFVSFLLMETPIWQYVEK